MKISKKYNGTMIGGIFTLASLLATFTFVIPIFSVLPGAMLESIMSGCVDNYPYSNVGRATITALLIMLAATLIIFLVFVRIRTQKEELSHLKVCVIMIVEYFILHALGFYVYWATSLNYRSDGQLMFAAVDSFPASSCGFFIIGILIDVVKSDRKVSGHTANI
jgi:hypothetical protein